MEVFVAGDVEICGVRVVDGEGDGFAAEPILREKHQRQDRSILLGALSLTQM